MQRLEVNGAVRPPLYGSLGVKGLNSGNFAAFRGTFSNLILTEIKEGITTRTCNRWQTPISAEQKLCLAPSYVGKQATIFNIVLLIIQSVITVNTKKCKYTNHLNSSAKLEV